jgi:peroxiredoxin (alkyl hydroperoxide reductase subunit C)
VVTVSTDTKFVHLAWQRDELLLKKAEFPMGSDPTGELSQLFGVYDYEQGMDLRGTFIINPKGVVMNSEVNFFNLGRNMDEILRKLRANLYLASAPAEACPAQWQMKGDTTLKPSEKLVGNVAAAMKKGKKKKNSP